MRRSGIRVRDLSNLSEDNKIGSRGNCGVRESEIMKHSARKGNIGNSEKVKHETYIYEVTRERNRKVRSPKKHKT